MSVLEQTPHSSFEASHNMAMQVFRHPEQFELIKGGYNQQDIYVERCTSSRLYDKHFWVTADEVELVRKHFAEKTAPHR